MIDSFDENTLFLTNKNGFPIDERTWYNMWKFAKYQYPQSEEKISELQAKDASELQAVKIPTAPVSFAPGLSASAKILSIQKYFNELQYNHTGTQFFEIKKYRSISGMMEDAKVMIKESLPIKCLEAVILGLYLTNKIDDLVRFPIGFKSSFEGHVHRHVVLGLFYRGNFGALGMSRRQDLMYKPLQFKTLTDLIIDYQVAYRRHWHSLRRVKIGGCVSQNAHSFETIPWKGVTVFPSGQPIDEMRASLEKYAKRILRFGGRLDQQQLPTQQQQQQQPQQQQQRQQQEGGVESNGRLCRSASMPGGLHRAHARSVRNAASNAKIDGSAARNNNYNNNKNDNNNKNNNNDNRNNSGNSVSPKKKSAKKSGFFVRA